MKNIFRMIVGNVLKNIFLKIFRSVSKNIICMLFGNVFKNVVGVLIQREILRKEPEQRKHKGMEGGLLKKEEPQHSMRERDRVGRRTKETRRRKREKGRKLEIMKGRNREKGWRNRERERKEL